MLGPRPVPALVATPSQVHFVQLCGCFSSGLDRPKFAAAAQTCVRSIVRPSDDFFSTEIETESEQRRAKKHQFGIRNSSFKLVLLDRPNKTFSDELSQFFFSKRRFGVEQKRVIRFFLFLKKVAAPEGNYFI